MRSPRPCSSALIGFLPAALCGSRIAPTIDLVLLSHSTLAHLGLFPYAYARLGLRCPIYATLPVQAMGRTSVLEAVESWRAEVDIDAESKRASPSATANAGGNSATGAAQISDVGADAGADGSDGALAQENGQAGGRKREKRRCMPTAEEVDEAFEEIKTLRYLQPTHLEGEYALPGTHGVAVRLHEARINPSDTTTPPSR